ncbi:efflux RND transporter permease subunit [Aestuariibacter salexigens]|uniref:efflux RND transporter permease subunit n=1 Tax=Aestuariibacter salexigens TaxID=226010 RepID=UPI0003F98279|nr:efflux RND transporter permease subunit [Aestuariibacter salexigens]
MKLVETAVKRPVTVWMFTFAVLLFGMVSLSRLAINLLPELSYPTLTIRTLYPGAAPGEIEQLVSKPIEESIGIVKGVHTVTSTSKAGQSDVVLEFAWGTDMDMASLEVREKLDILQLPLDVEKPLLLRFNPTQAPIVKLGLGSDSLATTDAAINANDISALKNLRVFADEQIKRKLESVEGVASVKIGGGLENEVQVLIDQRKAGQLNITEQEIVTRLRNENVNASGGRVEEGSQEYLVRTLNEFTSLDDMRDLFIATREGRHIRLGDIATVSDGYKERNSVTRFNGLEGVEIAIYKEGDANTVQVAKRVDARLSEIRNGLPADYQLQPIYDQSTFIANAIEDVKSAGIIGGLLAMVILYVFLKNIWPTLIISLSIPVSIIATFNLMYANEISLNIMSLGGIALAIGLLVDNSIVVLENIDKQKQQGKTAKNAAIIGTKEVSMAIVASTLTTMAVFFPLVFVEGIAGQLFSDQALTVTFALAASLIVALTLIPMLAARDGKKAQSDALDLGEKRNPWRPVSRVGWGVYYLTMPVRWLLKGMFYVLPLLLTSITLMVVKGLSTAGKWLFKPLIWAFNLLYTSTESGYRSLLNVVLRARVAVLSIILTISVASVLLLPRLGVELIPSLTQGEFFVEVSLPSGSPLAETDAVLSELATFTESQDGVARTYSLAGTGSLMNASPTQGGDHWGQLNVVMQSGASAETQQRVIDSMRAQLSEMAGVQSKFGTPALFSFDTPIEIEISGYDLGMLRRYGDRLVESMAQNPRFADVKTTLLNGNPELKIYFDHAKLAQLGLNAPDVSTLIATKVGGEVASKYSVDDRKVDIMVRSENDQRDSIADIGNMIVNPGSSPAVPLDAVAEVTLSTGPSEITRVGQQRVVVISANLAYGDLGDAVTEANQLIRELSLPLSMQADIAGQSEEMQASFTSLMFALGLAIFMVYLVMASQFESLLHPFIILFTVPLACAGSIYGLFITGTTVSVVVFIGLIMLAGIVVNNAIVLIDRINQLREQGMQKVDAIHDAAISRLRPIMMTTLTTVLGLLPMAIGMGEGAEVRTPMAITVIFGLLFASLLTLVLIPVLYSLFDRKQFASATQGETVYG